MLEQNLIINQESCRTFNNGLYIEPYFIKVFHIWKEIESGNAYDRIEYNRDLIAAYYREDLDNTDEENYKEEIDSLFWEALSFWVIYFKPLRYDEEAAFKCDLMPFKYSNEYEDLGLLALGGCGMDLSPKLDAYQALVDGTIDKHSKLFTDLNYFKYVLGERITQEVLKAITGERTFKLI